MTTFNYVVRDQEGRKLIGVVEASDRERAKEILRERQYIVISLTEKGGGLSDFLTRLQRVSISQKSLFARQLSVMVAAGVPLPDALGILKGQAASPRMQEVLGGMTRDIQGGSALSKSMAKYPDVFSPVFVALIEAGEASGKLEQILLELAEKLERDRVFRGKTRGAFIYPAVIILAMAGVFIIMVVFVIPRLVAMYADIGAELPLPTRILIGISNFLTRGWWIILLVLGVGGYAFRKFIVSDYGRYRVARITFDAPIFGKLSKEVQQAEFCRTLSLLVGAGVPITQSLEIVAGAMTNVLYHDAVINAARQVEKGIPLSVPLKKDSNFDPILSQMVKVGEETGKLDEVLSRLAGFFESESEQIVNNISSAIEPLVIIALGALIGLFVISIITPIYNLTSQL